MEKPLTFLDVLGYPIYTDTLGQLTFDKKICINTLNQYSYCIAEKDDYFKRALLESDVLIPDGIGIVFAAKFLKNRRIRKIAGAELHEFLLKKIEKENGSCFYFGSSEETLQKIKGRMAKEYPNIRIGTYSPPFKAEFSITENDKMIKAINDFGPDVLFVGMTAPKQEKWSYSHKESLNANTICSIGAVFDFYAGTMARPNVIFINVGLEWFGRLLREPKRMWKRYIYFGVVFAKHLLMEKTM